MARNRKVELSTIIGKGSKITGTLFVDGGVRVDGEIEGRIETNGFVTIGLSGTANADIKHHFESVRSLKKVERRCENGSGLYIFCLDL